MFARVDWADRQQHVVALRATLAAGRVLLIAGVSPLIIVDSFGRDSATQALDALGAVQARTLVVSLWAHEATLFVGSVATSGQNFETVNIGTGNRQTMVSLVRMLEELTGKRAVTHHAPFVPDDLPATQADTTRFVALTGVRPTTLVPDGLGHLLNWILSRTPARY